jgi:hypothetical protein
MDGSADIMKFLAWEARARKQDYSRNTNACLAVGLSFRFGANNP